MNRSDNTTFSDTTHTTTYTYDNGGRVLAQTQTDATNPANPVILSKNLFQYDRYGSQTFTALDVNQNGTIDFTCPEPVEGVGSDRVTGHTTTYISKDNALWQESTQSVYPDFNSDRAVTTTKSRRKLTNLGNFAAVSESEDIRGNVTTSMEAVDRKAGTTISSTTVPTSIQSQVQIQSYGQLVESVSTTAVTNRTAYDGLNRRIAVTDGRGNTSTMAYNSLGQISYTEDAATNRTSYVYDQYGRQIETIDALNQSTHTVYDLRGNVLRQYGATYPVWYAYDVEGRMTTMATARDTAFDPATVNSLDNPSLDVTRWIYDEATGLLAQKLYSDGKGPSYTYTPNGKLATRTWARGIVTSYAYDVLGVLFSVNYSDTTPDVIYTYDRLGRQFSAIADGVSTNLYAYSLYGQLTNEVVNGNTVLARTYDALGRSTGLAVAGVVDPGSPYAVSYGYDAYGRIQSVESAQSVDTFSYSYLPGTPLVSGMSASSSYAWSRTYEPKRNLITAVTNSFNGNLISAFDYTNDAISRRTERLDVLSGEIAITNSFGYNMCSEVTSAMMGTNEYGYAFDPIGNRIIATNNADVTSYGANNLNQYTAISNAVVVLPVHDEDGNMLTNGVWNYMWDGENRLIGVSSNDVLLVTYTYDHLSRRIGKDVWYFESNTWAVAESRTFLYDGWNMIREFQYSNVPLFYSFTNSYVWGLDLSVSLQGAGGVGGLLAVAVAGGSASGLYLPAYDANGNVMEYVSTNGTSVAHYEYSPFGETVVQFGDMADFFAFLFSTKYRENEAKLYYYGYRYYVPVYGRWLNRDPIGEKVVRIKGRGVKNGTVVSEYDFTKKEPNLYAFVLNIPTDNVDKDGRISFRWHGNWCGPGWTAGQWQVAASYDWNNDPSRGITDRLDSCCRSHDACYARKVWVSDPSWPGGGFWITNLDPWDSSEQDVCDDALCRCARRQPWSAARDGIICWFCDD